MFSRPKKQNRLAEGHREGLVHPGRELRSPKPPTPALPHWDPGRKWRQPRRKWGWGDTVGRGSV